MNFLRLSYEPVSYVGWCDHVHCLPRQGIQPERKSPLVTEFKTPCPRGHHHAYRNAEPERENRQPQQAHSRDNDSQHAKAFHQQSPEDPGTFDARYAAMISLS
jgi:hypothetical protein